MQDTGFLEFPLIMALQHVGSEVVLSQSFNKGCIHIPKVVGVALALLEPMGCVTVSALQNLAMACLKPKEGWMGHWRLHERTLLEQFLL